MTTTQDIFKATLGVGAGTENLDGARFSPERESYAPVEAPIIIDATTQKGVQPLLDMARHLGERGNKAVAEEESRKLHPYFRALSIYLTETLNKPENKDPTLKKLTSPGALSGLFNAMAACTKNTMTSEVVIMPTTIGKMMSVAPLFKGAGFKEYYYHNGDTFSFGFLQFFERDQSRQKKSSTVIPVFNIGQGMMQKIIPHQPEVLLKCFQRVMTIVNHDMLHHFTSTLINNSTVETFREVGAPITRWKNGLPGTKYSNEYEDWAQIGHESVLLNRQNSQILEDMRTALENYFDELKRISGELQEKYALARQIREGIDPEIADSFGMMMTDPLEDRAEQTDRRDLHQTVDFFGMMMAHALTRLLPLNHPLMNRCFERLQEADPFSTDSLADLYKNEVHTQNEEKEPSPSTMSVRIRRALNTPSAPTQTSFAIDSYRRSGLDLLQKDSPVIDYLNIKRLQQVRLSKNEVAAHVPIPAASGMAKLRGATAQLTLDMLKAAAATANYEPI